MQHPHIRFAAIHLIILFNYLQCIFLSLNTSLFEYSCRIKRAILNSPRVISKEVFVRLTKLLNTVKAAPREVRFIFVFQHIP